MKVVLRLLAAGIVVAPVFAADPAGFALWRAAELGTGIEGGERHALAAGDIVHIPAKIPHSFLVPAGKHITYVLVKFPAR